ncbi:hypothetical protein HYR69_00630 [Candidatus Sumerlaeota bacterium]|nr:hypothetical protein [Candidatus Sumerlaeota bacterium]
MKWTSSKSARRVAGFATASAFALALTGCISSYSNTARFTQPPHPGMPETEMLQRFGAPDYSGFVEDQKIYVYKVRDSKYIIIVGQYSGRDIVVTAKGGVVRSVQEVPRGECMTFLYAAPWMGHD